MMEVVGEKRLAGGETLRLLHWESSESAPRKYRDYISASFGMDHPNSNLYTIGGWRGYFHDAMLGLYNSEVIDHWFFAEIDGVCAGRIWFAYSRRSLRGNFGNVMTEPEFRQRGIMNELMTLFSDEFRKSEARILCCATGNKMAAASYIKRGFHFIYTGPTGPLAITKDGDFHTHAAEAFSSKGVAWIRPGSVGDQFDCDKFLTYIPQIWRRPFPPFAGAGGYISDFRLALQEQNGGRGVVLVAENPDGEVVGYAYGVMTENFPVVDFMVHPDYITEAPELLRGVAAAFTEKFPDAPELLYSGFAADKEKMALVCSSGGVIKSVIPQALDCAGKKYDMAIVSLGVGK